MDFEPKLRAKKTMIVGIVCVIGFLCGIPLTTRGGTFLLELLDYYAASWPYLFIGFCELILVSWVYGINNFLADLKHMIGFNPPKWLRYPFMFFYGYLSPKIILV